MLYRNLLIFHMDGFDHQYAVALDVVTGETVWKKDREIDYGTDNGDFYKAFSTPIIISTAGDALHPVGNWFLSRENDGCVERVW